MADTKTNLSCFARSFTEARGKFLTAAGKIGACVTTYVQPDCTGPDGGSLCIDVATNGPSGASRALLIMSGTHGPEGFCGSAAQIALLRSGALAALPHDTRVVLVHALNPYGFAHLTRTTENNVDLNRNFIDFSKQLPQNPAYRELHAATCIDEWTDAARAEGQRHTDNWIKTHGFPAWIDAMSRGQYDEPSGLNYGGRRREWSNLSLELIIAKELAGVAKVAFIDWHTGLGEFGQPFFLCFNDPESPELRLSASWWGADQLAGGGFNGASRPKYTGLVFHGVRQFIAPAVLAGAVIEFGTGPIATMFDWLRADRWLRMGTTPDDADFRGRLRQALQDAYCPRLNSWREGVLDHSLAIHRAALKGVAD
jgi:Protein of unknown function (DUF2817)